MQNKITITVNDMMYERLCSLAGKTGIKETSAFDGVYSRAVAEQIEHWARIGKIAEENPDLPCDFIREVQDGKAELESGDVSAFEFREE